MPSWSTTACGFRPLKGALDAFVDASQRFVTGDVRLRCELPGRCIVAGRRSDVGLYDYSLATYEAADRFRHQDAEGFVRLWGLGVATWAARQVGPGRGPPGRAAERRSMTLWQGRFGEDRSGRGAAGLHRQPSLRPAAGRRRHRRVAGPRAGPGRGRDPLRRARPRSCWPPSIGSPTSWRAARWSSSPATRTCTPPSNGGSPRSPATWGPGCTPAAAATTRSPPTCACSPSGSCWSVAHRIQDLQRVLLERARAAEDVYLPGYTHLQRAQPVLLAHHLLAHGWAFARDVDRLVDTRRRLDVSPLGAGALAGSSLPLDPDRVAAELGFAARFENSLDAVSDRDFVAEALFDLALIGVHLSRLGEEIVLWSSDEFGFVELADAYATGSSMLPQKKNPDIAELARGESGRVIGHLTGLLATLKGLPLAYNRDLQEDKEPFFDALDQVNAGLRAMTGLLLRQRPGTTARMQAAADTPFAAAVDLAEWLVERGMPFRQAHAVVGGLVRDAVERHVPLAELVESHPALGCRGGRAAGARGGRDPAHDPGRGRARSGGRAARSVRRPPPAPAGRTGPGPRARMSRQGGAGIPSEPELPAGDPAPVSWPPAAGGGHDGCARSFYDADAVAVAPRLLNKLLTDGRRPGRPHRGGGGLPRRAGPRQPRLPGPDGPQPRHVRAARPSLRLPQLRRPLVRQRGLRAGRRGPGGAPPGPGAGGRPRAHAPGPVAQPAPPGRPRPVPGARPAVPGPRHRPQPRRRRPDRSRRCLSGSPTTGRRRPTTRWPPAGSGSRWPPTGPGGSRCRVTRRWAAHPTGGWPAAASGLSPPVAGWRDVGPRLPGPVEDPVAWRWHSPGARPSERWSGNQRLTPSAKPGILGSRPGNRGASVAVA